MKHLKTWGKSIETGISQKPFSGRKILDHCFEITVETYVAITQATSEKKMFVICVNIKLRGHATERSKQVWFHFQFEFCIFLKHPA